VAGMRWLAAGAVAGWDAVCGWVRWLARVRCLVAGHINELARRGAVRVRTGADARRFLVPEIGLLTSGMSEIVHLWRVRD
jgi:hypothetical protein